MVFVVWWVARVMWGSAPICESRLPAFNHTVHARCVLVRVTIQQRQQHPQNQGQRDGTSHIFEIITTDALHTTPKRLTALDTYLRLRVASFLPL
jgi:hypothetical protein